MKVIEAIVMKNLGPIALGVLGMFALLVAVLIYTLFRTRTNRKSIRRKPSVSRTRELAKEELEGEVAEVVEEAFVEAVKAAIDVELREEFAPAIGKHMSDEYLGKEKAGNTYATKTALEELEAQHKKALEELEARHKKALEDSNKGLTGAINARVTTVGFEDVEKDLRTSIAVRASSEQMKAAQAELKAHRGRLEKLEGGGLDTSLDSSPSEEPSPHTRRAPSATMPPTGGRKTPVTLPPPASGAALAQEEEPEKGGGPNTRVWEPPSEKKTQLLDRNGPGNVTLNQDPSSRKTQVQNPDSRATIPGETLTPADRRKTAIREPGDSGGQKKAPAPSRRRRSGGRRRGRREPPS